MAEAEFRSVVPLGRIFLATKFPDSNYCHNIKRNGKGSMGQEDGTQSLFKLIQNIRQYLRPLTEQHCYSNGKV